MTYRRLLGEHREAMVHFERTQKVSVTDVGEFEVRLETVIMGTP
jgi:hypothetical protein